MSDLPENATFDRWVYGAVDGRVILDGGKPAPMMTVLLHRACGNNEYAFAEALRALQMAFEAGQEQGRRQEAAKIDLAKISQGLGDY